MQGFGNHEDFEIAYTAEADFNLANAGPVDARSQAHDAIRQLLLCKLGPRPQARLADTGSDDVFSHLKSP